MFLPVGRVGSGKKSLKSCPPSIQKVRQIFVNRFDNTGAGYNNQDLLSCSSFPPIVQVIFVNFNCALTAKICIAGLIDTSNVSNNRLVLLSIGISLAFGIWGSHVI